MLRYRARLRHPDHRARDGFDDRHQSLTMIRARATPEPTPTAEASHPAAPSLPVTPVQPWLSSPEPEDDQGEGQPRADPDRGGEPPGRAESHIPVFFLTGIL